MKAVIIEDEILLAEHLVDLLKEDRRGVSVVAIISSIKDAIAWFEEHPAPDIIFSDIRLTDGLSFEIFRKKTIDCPIIFTTSYDEYAVMAFKYNSIHYLQKPITKEALNDAFEKYDSIRKEGDITTLMTQILDHYGKKPKPFSPRLFVSRGAEVMPIDVDQISCIYTSERVVTCCMKNGKEFILEMSMKDLVDRLDPLLFKRISRQWIINISAIKRLSCGLIGKGHIIMEPMIDIDLSREKYFQLAKEFLK